MTAVGARGCLPDSLVELDVSVPKLDLVGGSGKGLKSDGGLPGSCAWATRRFA